MVEKENKSENKTGPLQVSLPRRPASALYLADVVRRLISHACLQAAVYWLMWLQSCRGAESLADGGGLSVWFRVTVLHVTITLHATVHLSCLICVLLGHM